MSGKENRAFTRFKLEHAILARVDSECSEGNFVPDHLGLVFEKSAEGCGLILLPTEKLRIGDLVRVQLGESEPGVAQVRWRKLLDETVLTVGLQYQA